MKFVNQPVYADYANQAYFCKKNIQIFPWSDIIDSNKTKVGLGAVLLLMLFQRDFKSFPIFSEICKLAAIHVCNDLNFASFVTL